MAARVLVLTKFAPDGPVFGGLQRTTRLLAALRRRFEVEVIGFSEDGEPAPRSRPSSLARSIRTGLPYQCARYDTPWLRARLGEALRRGPDAVMVDYVNQTPLVWDLDLPLAVDLHNVESGLSRGIAETSRFPTSVLAGRDARLLERVEQRVAERFALVTVPSAREVERMPGESFVVPNGIDPGEAPGPVEIDRDALCFVGTFSWAPNIDGAEWMCREVMPLLPDHLHLNVVGRRPVPRVRSLAGPRVTVTGEVPSVLDWVARAGVVVAPLLAPGGTRFKILEGLLASRPVVATPAAADGLTDLAGDGLVLADGPVAFARAVTDLAADPDGCDRLGRLGRAAVIERYDWARSQERWLDLIEERLGLS